jgi:hypothetical protein
MFFKQKNTISFFSSSKGVADYYPIEPSKDNLPKWLHNARNDFSERLKGVYPSQYVRSVHRCPGIISLMTKGFVIKAWQDFSITTDSNGTYEWGAAVSLNEYSDSKHIRSEIDIHNYDILLKYLPHKKDSFNMILKLPTPWFVYGPKNVKFLLLPVPYSDDDSFFAYPGILDTNYTNNILINLHWNCIDKTHVIRAGTPLVQIIPFEDTQYDYEVKRTNPKILDEHISKLFKLFNTFLRSYNKNS